MALDAETVRLVQASLPQVRELELPAAGHFYENLFAVAPELRAMFRDDLEGQGMRFVTALTTIADALDDPDALAAEIDGLARAHAGVGVRPEHFQAMGAALLVTLGETLGPAFDARLQAAWRAAYDHVAAEMIARGGVAGRGRAV